ncbi:TnpV protein [Solihabitans fulvus]|uniref:TnpV protein n=1 Tax=Solihabitans fulvus TaxID=1892852 RepID=A0A5B2W8V3_9PSEU|nr:TnpV protein [Solihabitans fulvus]KAA2247016.1 TnpV protein [Solihabitans fulvus]
MNRYGTMAQEHWARFLPARYSQIPDPTAFFTTLGREAEEAIADLADQMAGNDPPNESYLEKLGRLTAIGQQARERILAEVVLLPAEPGSELDETEPQDQPMAAERSTGWIPTGEDPRHPFWRDNPPQ